MDLRSRRLTLLLVLPLGLCPPAAADASGPSATVDAIVAAHLEARGGVDAMRSIRSLVYSGGTYREEGYEGDGNAFMAFQRPYYRVVGHPERPGNFLEGYDGSAWEWYGSPGAVVRTVGAASGAARRGTRFMGPFLDWRRDGSSVKLGEPAEIDGRPADRLVVTTRDGFTREYFVDRGSRLIVAERRTAPFHAFGEPVTTETRVGDHREVAGVLFPHRYRETEIATGRMMSEMQWGSIEANVEMPSSWFSPPEFTRTRLQAFLENLYRERADVDAVLWSYDEFRRAHPEIDTAAGVEWVGYQMLKMGDEEVAVILLEQNLRDHPESASAAFSLGRAQATAGDESAARSAYERALALDPDHRRAAAALAALDAGP